jgi:hypothetical protein
LDQNDATPETLVSLRFDVVRRTAPPFPSSNTATVVEASTAAAKAAATKRQDFIMVDRSKSASSKQR